MSWQSMVDSLRVNAIFPTQRRAQPVGIRDNDWDSLSYLPAIDCRNDCYRSRRPQTQPLLFPDSATAVDRNRGGSGRRSGVVDSPSDGGQTAVSYGNSAR